MSSEFKQDMINHTFSVNNPLYFGYIGLQLIYWFNFEYIEKQKNRLKLNQASC